jgi:hypothetical protein
MNPKIFLSLFVGVVLGYAWHFASGPRFAPSEAQAAVPPVVVVSCIPQPYALTVEAPVKPSTFAWCRKDPNCMDVVSFKPTCTTDTDCEEQNE